MASNGHRKAFRTCPLCEATCGLELTLDGERLVSIRGDADDVFSHGFICPKGAALKQLHEDPDCVTTPLIRDADGFRVATWDEALALIDERLPPVLAADRNAVGVYLGNPSVHNLSGTLYARVLLRALSTRSLFSASTVDQMPKQLACALMFGTSTTVPVPDIDRTQHLLMLGANPLASNGSLMTAPDMRGRLRALRGRGGKLVVIDPRRTRTAEAADEHHFIRPGTDAQLLFALVNVLFADGLADPGERLRALCDGLDEVRTLSEPFTPEAVAGVCGIGAAEIRRLASELAAAPTAAVYGRIGTCTQEFGTLASWLVDVINLLTGNLDRPGGAMFPLAAAGHANATGEPRRGRGARMGRFASRVRGLPEVFGELPVACLAEEIDTPGEGQVRALITIAGNPVLSTPNSGRLDAALETLEFMVSLDVYVNETTRHADVILPAPSSLRRGHYDVALYQFAVRNVAHYSPPVLPPEPDLPDEWITLLRLTGIASGLGPAADVVALDETVARAAIARELETPRSPVAGRAAEELLEALAPRVGPERLLDLMLRAGPYGDGFGARTDGGLSLENLETAAHGVDLGALTPRLPDVLRTPSGMIELAPAPIVADVPRLRQTLSRPAKDGPVLVGRRQLRSNNSWMHNLPMLVRGRSACTLHVHPQDAARYGLTDGQAAELRTRTGAVTAEVEVTDAVMPGVVSLPHGWGHDGQAHLSVAAAHAGTNSNVLADELLVDAVSGNAVLNGIPVALAPARPPAVPESSASASAR
ncbi:MAG TPA: molybdopterin-dependent oxidoreductase [Solirubrobacteraceae bacterium]|nr:molybdopterin-dependent oxidoreductase [Solirubrobacteraceae bacterium]